MPNKKVVKQITDQEMKLAQMLLMGKSLQECAVALGVTWATASAWSKTPCVVAWMQTASAKVVEKTAETAAEKIASASAFILSRYMSLAKLEATKENGMVIIKACDAMRDMLGLKAVPAAKPGDIPEDPAKPPEVYRSKWLKPGEPVQ